MSAAFSRFDILTVRKKNDVAAEIKVYLGTSERVKAVVPYDINIGVTSSGGDDINVKVTHTKELVAPIAQGQEIGKLTISKRGAPPQIVPLLAMESVPAKKGISRAINVLMNKIGGS